MLLVLSLLMTGPPKSAPAPVRAAAIADARRKLAETLHRQVDQAVAAAAVADEGFVRESGIYEVRLKTTMTGSEATGSVRFEPPVEHEQRPRYAPGAPAPKDALYTALVIDCRGLRVRSTPSPKLWSSDGHELYGTVSVSEDFLFDQGIVAYPSSMDQVRHSARLGDHPLILRAIGVKDSTRCEPILSRRDAERLLKENRQDHFLERCAVVFLIDP